MSLSWHVCCAPPHGLAVCCCGVRGVVCVCVTRLQQSWEWSGTNEPPWSASCAAAADAAICWLSSFMHCEYIDALQTRKGKKDEDLDIVRDDGSVQEKNKDET